MTPRSYQLIVIGAHGLVGSSAFYQAAKLCAQDIASSSSLFNHPKVLGIDQFEEGHSWGSSHGETRITRVAIGEGDEYVALAKRSHEIWEEVETETQHEFGKLLNIKASNAIGGLIIGPAKKEDETPYHGSKGGFLQRTQSIAAEHQIPYKILPNAELAQTFPQFKIREQDAGYCEESMGFIRPDACIKANVRLAKKHGGELRTGEKVLKFTRKENGKIEVVTSKARYETDKLIVAAGPWVPELIEEHAKELKVCRQTVYHFDVKKELRDQFTKDKFPTFIWNLDSSSIIYGFPIMGEGNAIKLGTESYATVTTPDSVNRKVSEEEINTMYETLIKPYLPGVTNHCVSAKVCLYTVAPQWRFVVDFMPNFGNNVIVASPCSGHGAKHAAAMGEAIAQQAIRGKSNIPVIELFGGLLSQKEDKQQQSLREF